MSFGYSGPSVSAAFVAGVFNDAWESATQRALEAKDWSRDAISRASAPPVLPPPSPIPLPKLPGVVPMATTDAKAAQAMFDSNGEKIRANMVKDFADFLFTHFGGIAEFDSARSWLQRALNGGGTGISPVIEQQLFERERSRLLNEAARSEDEIVTTWAARRFPLPPGAAAAQLARLRKETDDKIASAAREVAVQAATLEIENVRLAVGQAISMRVSAISAAGEYIRNLAMAPQLGAQLTTALLDSQARAADTVVKFYQAQLSAAELPVRVQTTNSELQLRANEANQRTASEAMNQRVQATLAAAQSLGTQAAAALNSLHAQAGISANESL